MKLLEGDDRQRTCDIDSGRQRFIHLLTDTMLKKSNLASYRLVMAI